jgi:4-amino-4-deoxy-L-arabinose transferase-like glycosyltransferase
MVCGHLFTILLFCGSISLLYGTIRKSCGEKSASLLALILATSAGILQFNHWGTVDSPLLFWMLASFAFSIRASATGFLCDSILAGLLAGLAAADKYNGLGVAVALPVALLMHSGWRALYRMPLILGCLAVPLGFVIGCPGVIFDHDRFVQQFLYNLYTTPVYYGSTHKLGYLDFLASFPELIGLPASIALAGCVAGTILLLSRGSLSHTERTLVACAGIFFLGYYINIGSFPRMEARFVLPVVPFAFILGAPALQRIRMTEKVPSMLFSAIMVYNLICCFILGFRFLFLLTLGFFCCLRFLFQLLFLCFCFQSF